MSEQHIMQVRDLIAELQRQPEDAEVAITIGGTLFNKHDLARGCAVAVAMSDADKDCRLRGWREPGSDQVELMAVGGGDSGVEMVDAPGDPLHFYLNASYLKAALAKTPTEQVRVVSKDNALFLESGDLTAVIPQMIDPIKR